MGGTAGVLPIWMGEAGRCRLALLLTTLNMFCFLCGLAQLFAGLHIHIHFNKMLSIIDGSSPMLPKLLMATGILNSLLHPTGAKVSFSCRTFQSRRHYGAHLLFIFMVSLFFFSLVTLASGIVTSGYHVQLLRILTEGFK